MNKTSLFGPLAIAAGLALSANAFAQQPAPRAATTAQQAEENEEFPPNAEPGSCYARCVTAARYETYDEQAIAKEESKRIAASPGTVVCQFWGDMDHVALRGEGVSVWPLSPPHPGHMAILPSEVGPEPVVRLQCGGLKVGELLWRARRAGCSAREAVAQAVASGFANAVDERVHQQGPP